MQVGVLLVCACGVEWTGVPRTNIPVHTETEQYTHIQSPAPEDECNKIRNMLSNKKLS